MKQLTTSGHISYTRNPTRRKQWYSIYEWCRQKVAQLSSSVWIIAAKTASLGKLFLKKASNLSLLIPDSYAKWSSQMGFPNTFGTCPCNVKWCKLYKRITWQHVDGMCPYRHDVRKPHEPYPISIQATIRGTSGENPNWRFNLRTFGEIALLKVGDRFAKLDDRGIVCTFVSYSDEHPTNTYRFVNMKTNKVMMCRDVFGFGRPGGNIRALLRPTLQMVRILTAMMIPMKDDLSWIRKMELKWNMEMMNMTI
jgi:hypothetical protein